MSFENAYDSEDCDDDDDDASSTTSGSNINSSSSSRKRNRIESTILGGDEEKEHDSKRICTLSGVPLRNVTVFTQEEEAKVEESKVPEESNHNTESDSPMHCDGDLPCITEDDYGSDSVPDDAHVKQYWFLNREQIVATVFNIIWSTPESEHILPLHVRFIGEEDTQDIGGPTQECFRLFFEQMFFKSSLANKLFYRDEQTGYMWPLHTNLDATQEERNWILKFWNAFGKIYAIAMMNAQWSVFSQPLAPRLMFKMIKNEPIDITDVAVSFPTLDKSLRSLDLETLEAQEWSFSLPSMICDLKHTEEPNSDSWFRDGRHCAEWTLGTENEDGGLELFRQRALQLVGGMTSWPLLSNNPNVTELLGGFRNIAEQAQELRILSTMEMFNHFQDSQNVYMNALTAANLRLNTIYKGKWKYEKHPVLDCQGGDDGDDDESSDDESGDDDTASVENGTHIAVTTTSPGMTSFVATQQHQISHHDYIETFWSILAGWSPEQIRKLLLFVSSNADLPRQIYMKQAKFYIRMNGHSLSLPTSKACFNELWLPIYPSSSSTLKEILESKLLWCLDHSEGFGLV